ncbi:MAG: hypothetical protein CMK83_00775 [Pseudomonadales bacterium]|nr:hypothetical protein [Pseudomonadales bacterium]
MSLIGNVNSGNNPYAGGSKTPNAPPPNLGGSIPSANTGNAPIQGVNPPGQPFYARNNEGSNIGIPYTRLVPLAGRKYVTGLVVPATGGAGPVNGTRWLSGTGAAPPVNMEGTNDRQRLGGMQTITETEDMRATKIGFILGRRTVGTGGSAIKPKERGDNDESYEYGNEDYSYFLSGTDGVNGVVNVGQDPNGTQFHGWLAPGMSGTERFQKMCSLEFLQGYFATVLRNKKIPLNGLVVPSQPDMIASNPAGIAFRQHSGYNAEFVASFAAQKIPNTTAAASITNVPDFAPMLGEEGSDLEKSGNPAKGGTVRKQGVFLRDEGPFLRGKGITNEMLNGTVGGSATSDMFGKQRAAYRVSRNIGDEIAFDMLDKAMEEAGLTDWRPDGIVLSKGANDPSDQLSDEFFEARDGQLFNMRIQGPAHTTTWTGDPAMEVLPGDKVFIAIVADVWFDIGKLTGNFADIKTWLDSKTTANSSAAWNKYAAARDKYFSDELLTEDRLGAFLSEGKKVFRGASEESVLTNFRVITTTSSQMINYSPFKWTNSADLAAPTKRRQAVDRAPNNETVTLIQGASRMGLRLGELGGEYIIGAWQIGTVLDSAASRAVMPGGSFMGVRTAPNTMAHNVYVNIGWWSADRLWRTYMNVEGTVKPRYIKSDAKPTHGVNLSPDDSNSAHNKA